LYVWLNPNRRDRRARKQEQVEPFLDVRQVEQERIAVLAQDQADEETRRMLELREMDTAVQKLKPAIESYLQTAHGKAELKDVVAEMKRLKLEHHKHHPAAEEEVRLQALAKKEAAENGTPADKLLHEIEKKEHVRSIFEVFDADASGAMDATEMTELLKELCLPYDPDDVDEMMEEMDEDGSGEIDFEEFYSW